MVPEMTPNGRGSPMSWGGRVKVSSVWKTSERTGPYCQASAFRSYPKSEELSAGISWAAHSTPPSQPG